MFAFQERLGGNSSSYLVVSEESQGIYSPFDIPKEVGCYSIDSSKRIHFNRSQMKYYIPAAVSKLPFDLNAGYESTIRKVFDRTERMEQFLRWILYQGIPTVDKLRCPTAVDFATLRGTLQRILCAPYNENGLIIYATKFNGVIYFVEHDSDALRLRLETETERERLMSSWGYKFEQYMTAATPYGPPDMTSRTQELEEYSIVITNKLKNHSLLIKAEVDAVSTFGTGTSSYVELKTSKMSPTFNYDYVFQKYKSLQWWAQSYVVGIKEIVCGMRDDCGRVRSIETFKTDQLPSMCMGKWQPYVCLNFCNKFLDFLKANIIEDDHRVVYRLDFIAKCVSCQKLPRTQGVQILPDWFAAAINSRS